MREADPTEKWRGDKPRVREAYAAELKRMAVCSDESHRRFASAVMRLLLKQNQKPKP